MNTTTRIGTAERLGRGLGRGWRAYARGERRVSNWLTSKGVPLAGAVALLWAVKLVALGMLLYATSWLALLLVFAMVAAWVARNAGLDDDLPDSACTPTMVSASIRTSRTTSSAYFFDAALIAMPPPLPPAALASPVAPARPCRMLPARTPAQANAMTQNVGSTMNIVPKRKFSSMSPNALFKPTSESKLLCGRFHPHPHP